MNNFVGTPNVPDPLVQKIAAHNAQPVELAFQNFKRVLQQRYGEALDAIVLYGSCLHTSDLTEGIADFYVLVDDYRRAYPGRMLAYLNVWLPPNVFYLEVPAANGVMRAKYAVISTSDFECGAAQWFHPYIWARFAQPTRLLYARNDSVQQRVCQAQARAVLKFINTTLPRLKAGANSLDTIWTTGLMLTYAAELRAERKERTQQLIQRDPKFYNELTHAALPALDPLLGLQADGQYHVQSTTALKKLVARIQWRLRRWQGRLLSILRLSKATLTFRDCLDYAAWKIERHTGVKVEITPMLRRHPILWGYKVMWQLLRRGVLR
ncbi:hypothetical protein Nstercoris_00170 [Nitrosomonas stercoris]|uniref:Phosphatidate cytidylyltransferase n=1 Tax=Nitrosomonas stercoris TaxID=1444684 RepID=A0A4Y1YIN3_9PROT|nr:hypothetical protein Nstercoris_00170 [Nitrosomonas stercoris]